MERSSSQLYVDGWDGMDGVGWLSYVVGSLRAPSVIGLLTGYFSRS